MGVHVRIRVRVRGAGTADIGENACEEQTRRLSEMVQLCRVRGELGGHRPKDHLRQ